MNADGSRKRNLTRDRAIDDDYPTWSPDGRRIAFLRVRAAAARYQLYVVNADGSGLRNLTRIPAPAYSASQLVWSPDGRTIYFGRYLVSTDGSGARKLPYIPLTAVWSPDGRQIAFVGNRETGLPGPGAAGPSRLRDLRHERRRERNPQADAQPAMTANRPGPRTGERSLSRAQRRRQQGDLRHERRRERNSGTSRETQQRTASFLVAGRAEDRVRQRPRRASRGSRHERRRERSAESDARGT